MRQLNEAMARIVNAPEVKAHFLAGGEEVVGGSPEDYAAIISSVTAKWAKVIRDANIRAE